MSLYRVGPVGAVATGEKLPVHIEGKYLLLVGSEHGPALVDGICPHAGSDLMAGDVVGNRLRCPTHRFFFNLADGGCAVGRREGWGPLGVYPLTEEDGFLCVDLSLVRDGDRQ